MSKSKKKKGKYKTFYTTWQEASRAAKKLGIFSKKCYLFFYSKDKLLPSNPRNIYKDFPGFVVFLGNNRRRHIKSKDVYRTWKQASKACLRLGIHNGEEYKRRYHEDDKLPSRPDIRYVDFPGCAVFFNQKEDPHTKKFYKTWKEIVAACIKLGINSSADYLRLYHRDGMLPNKSRFYTQTYAGFTGFPIFKR